MFITVNTPGALLRLDVNVTDTVYSLKLLIAGYVGLLPEHQRLLYNGIQLIDTKRLADYNGGNPSVTLFSQPAFTTNHSQPSDYLNVCSFAVGSGGSYSVNVEVKYNYVATRTSPADAIIYAQVLDTNNAVLSQSATYSFNGQQTTALLCLPLVNLSNASYFIRVICQNFNYFGRHDEEGGSATFDYYGDGNGIPYSLITSSLISDYNIQVTEVPISNIIIEVAPISNCPCKPVYKKKTISNAMSVSGRAKTSYHGGMYGIITVSESDGGTGTGTDSSSSFTWPASMACLSSAQTCNIPYFNRVQSHLFPGTRSRTTKRGWNCRR